MPQRPRCRACVLLMGSIHRRFAGARRMWGMVSKGALHRRPLGGRGAIHRRPLAISSRYGSQFAMGSCVNANTPPTPLQTMPPRPPLTLTLPVSSLSPTGIIRTPPIVSSVPVQWHPFYPPYKIEHVKPGISPAFRPLPPHRYHPYLTPLPPH
eukprot:scaffold13183_cov82-Isochrysis_galbana.AAC.1